MADDRLAGASWTCVATAPGVAAGPDEVEKQTVEWRALSVPGTAAAAVTAASGWEAAAAIDYDASDWWFRCRVPDAADTADPADPADSADSADSADTADPADSADSADTADPADSADSADTDAGGWVLTCEGLATVADVWFAGRHVAHSENMFVPVRVGLDAVRAGDELVIRIAALTPLLGVRRPRPRWKTQMATHQSLRWFRTSYLGRQPGWVVTPAAVGPWRPVRLERAGSCQVTKRRVVTRCGAGGDGVVSVSVRLDAGSDAAATPARLRIRRPDGSHVDAAVTVRNEESATVVEGEVTVPAIERWWPHTHGGQPLYQLTVELGGETVPLGRVGFREVAVDRSDGRFTVLVNGVEVFCRGACWWPVDAVGFHAADDELGATLGLVVEAHMNMVRIPGGTVYEDGRFWDLCDELGIMVWQDSMLGYTDPPEDAAFEAAVVAEVEHLCEGLGGRPALAVMCGGQEIEEQAAMFGLSREKWSFPLTETTIAAVVDRLLPGVPYVTSSPTGGDLPFQPDVGDCHYWGVGSYLRAPEDARRSGIRFMSEGIGLATPPERQTVEEACGGAWAAGHDPQWKRAVHHDTGRSVDLDDVRDHYVQELLGVDPRMVRYLDPERAIDLGRAVSGELVGRTLAEWRRPLSTCAGGITVALRDLVPGAGWGLIDALGRPKAPWYTLRRVLAPVAVLVSDEGLNGLHLHVLNDGAELFVGRLEVALFARGEVLLETGRRAVDVGPRGHLLVEAGALFDGFRDLAYSYRFGPPAYDVVAVTLRGDADNGTGTNIADDDNHASEPVSEVVHLPAGLVRPHEAEVGLEATATPGADGSWTVTVTTRRLAQWVVVEVPGYRPTDSWFHLAPGGRRSLRLVAERAGGRIGALRSGADGPPAGVVRALNAQTAARIRVT